MVSSISTPPLDHGSAKEVGKQGETWKQWLMTFIASIPFFTSALQHTYISSCQNDQPLYWISTALMICSVVSAPLFCWQADRLGRRKILLTVTVLQIISWIPLLCDLTETTYIISSALLGICNGGIFTIIPIYVLEVSNQKTKGVAVTSLYLMWTIGVLVTEVLVLENVSMMIYVVLALVIVQTVVMWWLIETPSYFVIKGEIVEATNALVNLKQLPSDTQFVQNCITELCKESDTAKAIGSLNFFIIGRHQVFRAGLQIGLALQTVVVLGGRLVFLEHARVLQQSGADMGGAWEVAAPAAMVAAALLAVTLVDLVERKYFISLSYALTAVGLGLLGVFMQGGVASPAHAWAPKPCLMAVVIGHALGYGIAFLVGCEVLNLEIRSTLFCVVFVFSKILEIIHLQTYPYAEVHFGSHCMIYIFALINLIGVVYALFAVPECKNRTVRQIEKQLKRVPIIK